MALNIKNPEVERLASEVAALSRVSKTEAIRVALEERRRRLREQQSERVMGTLRWLQEEVWPKVPETARDRLSKTEEEEVLGDGND